MTNAAIIVAAGTGKRFESEVPKQFVKINEIELFIRSLMIFDIPQIKLLLLMVNPEMIEMSKNIIKKYDFNSGVEVVAGGDTRQESVFRGLKYLEKYEINKVIIHDAARPLFRNEDASRILNFVKSGEGAVVVSNIRNTVYEVDRDRIINVPDRNRFLNAETPQVFIYKEIFEAHKRELTNEIYNNTDDTQIYLKSRFKMNLYKISYNNLKITHKEDLFVAEALLNKRESGRKNDG
jgi:2-C-methyl-D-erythritol 4-phosphate cytidylyltransferase